MKNSLLTIDEIKKLHADGQLEAAKKAYLALLNEQPDSYPILHLLGILCMQEGNLDEAKTYLEKAHHLQADDPTLTLHLANVLKSKGLFKEAIALLTDLIKRHPQQAEGAYNNLGTIYFAEKKWQEAINCYQKALDSAPHYIDAYYNLGLAQTKAGRFDEAIHTYNALLSLSPQHLFAHFQLACLLMQKTQYRTAISHFLLIESDYPHHFETETNLATCYLKEGLLKEAILHYRQALEVQPDDPEIHFNLGVIHMQQGRIEPAISHYQEAIHLDPNYFAAHHNLAIAWMTTKNTTAALNHFREALRLQPTNETIAHLIAVLAEKKDLTVSPLPYVETLFDSYADHYEPHLLQGLNYQVPSLLKQAVQEVTPIPDGKWEILDLGCGTGLTGSEFKSAASKLIGVDISAKMLAIAAQKSIYDELIHTDILSFLAMRRTDCDLIVAGDALLYFGELEDIFKTMSQALKPGGLCVFDLEVSDKAAFQITPSGRFAHHKNYIDALAHKYDLLTINYRVVVLRTQNNLPVYGHLYVMEKQVNPHQEL